MRTPPTWLVIDQPGGRSAFALPRRFAEKGVHRYGFHGLSYEYILEELAALDPAAAKGRVVIAHLGSGASMSAVRDGRCVAQRAVSSLKEEGLVRAVGISINRWQPANVLRALATDLIDAVQVYVRGLPIAETTSVARLSAHRAEMLARINAAIVPLRADELNLRQVQQQ